MASARCEAFHAVNPASGQETGPTYRAATTIQVDEAARAAWLAFNEFRGHDPTRRATLLRGIADGLERIQAPLVRTAIAETGLTEKRLLGELHRTVGTLRFFADVVRDGGWARPIIDRQDAPHRPTARHDLRRLMVPLGPVAVFGASNFPLAYSTAGTDTASALAAGCPVVVKGHALHPGTGELVAWVVVKAIEQAGFPRGWFSFLHAGGERERPIGTELVRHPCIRAAGFTGSRAGGDALAEVAQSRTDPIPFFAEMGSVNPVFVLPSALSAEADNLGRVLGAAVAASAGQQCTCPGLIFCLAGSAARALVASMASIFDDTPDQPMLAARIRTNYLRRVNGVATIDGVNAATDAKRIQTSGRPGPRPGAALIRPMLFETTAEVFMEHESLHEEIFGPAAIVVTCQSEPEMARCVGAIAGSLTGSIFLADGDDDLASQILLGLEHRVGRIIFNGVPTGVEVAHAMVHGGPYPATNRPDTTAVGPEAMLRWCRPVCYQGAPSRFLPPELRDQPPSPMPRMIDGKVTLLGD